MAFRLSPTWGQPGAPYGTNWWDASRFMMSDLLTSPPPSPPPPPLAPTPNPLDYVSSQGLSDEPGNTGATGDAGSYGGEGAGQPGTLGGLGQPDPYGRGMDPYAGAGPIGNLFSGWGSTFNNPAAYTPAQFDSRYGLLGGTLGMTAGSLAGVPGLGTGFGTIGEMVDLGRYVDNLRAAGIQIDPSYLSAAWAGLSSLPFGIGNIVGTSARAQSENARRDALAEGVVVGNVDPAILDRTNAPPAPFDPTYGGSFDLSYGYGAAPGGEGTMAAPEGQTGYQSGTYQSGIEGGSPDTGPSGGPVGSGPEGGSVASGAGDPNYGGGSMDSDRFGWARGGRVTPPPRPVARTQAEAEADQRALLGMYGATSQDRERIGLPNFTWPVELGMPIQPAIERAEALPRYAAGGTVTPQTMVMLRGIDPPGPDDQIGGLQTGEGVLTRKAMQQYPGLLSAANRGAIAPAAVKGLLAPRRRT